MRSYLISNLIDASQENSNQYFDETIIEETLLEFQNHISKLSIKDAAKILLSTQNYIQRASLKIHETFEVNCGDVCYIDFGQAYLNESGFQHFGLVISKLNGKVFVIPMTSNPYTYAQAYDRIENPNGRKHLMRFGQRNGLNRESVLFINDCKFINPTRIIEIVGHLDLSDELFYRIQKRVGYCLFKEGVR
jgi:hypothetical protein